MSLQMMLPIFDRLTSSPGSADGAEHSGWLAGQTIGHAGPDPRHASLSARQASERGLLISGTSGPPGFGSSGSVALTQSLASKLARTMDLRGSMLFRLTWKTRVTKSGRSIYALRARARRTIGRAFTSWPTPMARDSHGGPLASRANGRYFKLQDMCLLAPWPTPAARDYRYANQSSYQERSGTTKGEQLNNQVVHSGPTLIGLPAQMEKPDQLNPEHTRWLMGYPDQWARAAPGSKEWNLWQQKLIEKHHNWVR